MYLVQYYLILLITPLPEENFLNPFNIKDEDKKVN